MFDIKIYFLHYFIFTRLIKPMSNSFNCDIDAFDTGQNPNEMNTVNQCHFSNPLKESHHFFHPPTPSTSPVSYPISMVISTITMILTIYIIIKYNWKNQQLVFWSTYCSLTKLTSLNQNIPPPPSHLIYFICCHNHQTSITSNITSGDAKKRSSNIILKYHYFM